MKGKIIMIPMELATMAGGAAMGYVFKFLAERAKERQAQFTRMMGAIDKSDESSDKAAQRVSIDAGKWVRRFIVFSILFAVIYIPFMLALTNNPTVIQVTQDRPEWLFGLFGGGAKTQFVQLQGYLMIEEVRQTLTALVGFYFGSAVAKTK